MANSSNRTLYLVAGAIAVIALLWMARPRTGAPTATATHPQAGAGRVSPSSAPAAQDAAGVAQLRAQHFLPDPATTPGATLDVTAADICVPGYSKKVRNVPSAVKHQAYDAYGIQSHQPGEYEVDHLISLELGGSNSIRNLWPESFVTHPWNAHVKDQLENELHRAVCAHEMELATAQQEISGNWIAAWQRHFHRQLPDAAP